MWPYLEMINDIHLTLWQVIMLWLISVIWLHFSSWRRCQRLEGSEKI